MQRATEEAFQKLGYNGAAVILDPRNGEVLSYVSLPAYDPNEFAARGPGFGATWAVAQHRQAQAAAEPRDPGPLLARVHLQDGGGDGGAPRGRHRRRTSRCTAPGGATFYGRPFQCWSLKARATVTARSTCEHAIEQSCNVYFYTLGNLVGIDKISKWAKLLGLGEKSGIDLPNEVQGIIPSPEWKKATTGEKWYAGETISVSIGQGQVSVTPVSMAVYISTIANGGTRYVPHLVRARGRGQRAGKCVPAPEPRSKVEFKPETIEALHEGLWLVVNGARHRRQREDPRQGRCRARPAPRR